MYVRQFISSETSVQSFSESQRHDRKDIKRYK